MHITDDASPENYSPGHAISDGTNEKTQREVLEFEGFDVTDDSVNGKTKVAEVPYTAGRGVAITNKEVAVDETIATTFTGTQAEWNALTATEKAKYNLVNITDDAASGAQVVVDEVTEGNMNAVTSNAVAEKVAEINDDLATICDNIAAGNISGTSHTSTVDGNIAIYGRSSNGIHITVTRNGTNMWEGFLPSDGTYGTMTPIFFTKSGDTVEYTINTGTVYDAHFVVYR